MRDAGNDERNDVGDDFRWLSYGKLGQARGISAAPQSDWPFDANGRVRRAMTEQLESRSRSTKPGLKGRRPIVTGMESGAT